MFSCCQICLASSEDRIETPERTDDKQSSSTISTSTTSPAASRPSTDSSSQDPPAPGRKRALLCGVTSSGARRENLSPGLKGPVNDVEKIKEMLIKFGYNTDDQNCIRVLMTEGDQEINGNELSATSPTKKNIEDSLKWLVEGAKSGDSLVFFFSGHGCSPQQPDQSNHVICNLVDCEGNVIPNSYINSTIVRPLEEGVTLYAVVDACHSGSILDLNFEYNQESNDWTDLSKLAEKGTSGGLAICLSACRNDLTAPETNANSSGKVMGAMTYHLTDMVKSKLHPANVTYEEILKKMHYLHEDWKTKQGEPLVAINERCDLLRKFSESQKVEIPVLSSSHNFQVSSKKFLQAAPL